MSLLDIAEEEKKMEENGQIEKESERSEKKKLQALGIIRSGLQQTNRDERKCKKKDPQKRGPQER